MRAAVLGLIGAVLAVGSAGAAGCPIDRVTYKVIDPGVRLYGVKIERPDLIGARLRVVRHSSEFKTIPEAGFSEPTESARLSMVVSGSKGKFVVEQNLVTHSSPAMTASSWAMTVEPPMGRKNISREKKYFGANQIVAVSDGPLASLQLKPVACR